MRSEGELFWVWLSEALGIANKNFRALITLYETPYDIFHAEEAELERIPDISARTLTALSNKSLQRAYDILDSCERMGIGILPYGDQRYPYDLRDIEKPPVLLYYRGKLPDFNQRFCVGMVGTRSMSAYGMDSAYKIAYELAAVDAIVVSGMASGIDGVCAAAALKADGHTVAVLGSGVDIVYPPHHQTLYERIVENGTVLSEFAPGTRPRDYYFPIRNRIISGLSRATVVVEAGIRSGSLITAKDAILQGRDVFAIPANVGSRGAEGTNGLLRDGANMALETADILRPYEFIYRDTLAISKLEAAKVSSVTDLAYLNDINVIELVERSKMNPSTRVHAPSDPPPKKRARKAMSPKEKKQTDEREAPLASATAAEADVPPAVAPTPDHVLSTLTEIQRAVLEAIPDDRAVSTDSLSALGFPYGEMIAALTMLEIMGLLQKLPGGLYTKA